MYPALVSHITDHYVAGATYQVGPLTAETGKMALPLLWTGAGLAVVAAVLHVVAFRQARRHQRRVVAAGAVTAHNGKPGGGIRGFGGVLRRKTGDLMQQASGLLGPRDGKRRWQMEQKTSYERVTRSIGSESRIDLAGGGIAAKDEEFEENEESRRLWDAEECARSGRKAGERYEPMRERDV